MVKSGNKHVVVVLGVVLAAIVIAGAIFLGMKLGADSQAAASGTTGTAAPTAVAVGRGAAIPNEPVAAQSAASQAEVEGAQRPSQALSFNAIGSYVKMEAGYVCEGERWALIGAENDPNGNHLMWQGENGESREFSYQWDGKNARLTDIATGKQTSFPMVHLEGGDWLVNGKRLQECAG